MAGETRQTTGRVRATAARAAVAGVIGALVVILTPGPASAAGEVTPVLNCTKPAATGKGFTAILGYDNSTGQDVTVPYGRDNRVVNSQYDGAQPTHFTAGRHDGAFVLTITHSSASWTLGGTVLLIKPSEAPACPAGTQLPADGNGIGTAVALGAAGAVGAFMLHRSRRRLAALPDSPAPVATA